MGNALVQMIAKLEDENVMTEVKRQLEAGTDPVEIFGACQDGMVEVGKKFQAGEFFVSDLMMSGAIFKDVGDLIKPYLKSTEESKAEKVVVGTVEGDIHDIGKDLVVAMLSAGNFDVIDVGVDVKPMVFVDALKESGAKVLGLSCLLTTCYDAVKETVAAVAAAGLRDQVKIMIGGGPVDQGVVEYTGADAYGKDAQDAVKLCKELM
ncbi:cobalamin B12-binding domain-containing protein [Geosporobacter ferrireducens]|uniref:Cobalamin-binding protein n=1 Tax=Geosporobacter ferrireducens TaxID=1424294 RepID=A0A1D8GJA5_9FIRM|nr:cobalamin-dependent protein [Geosporobacter ferrireducens]AOT70993.1 cobalamin-binding protein [Geosporobacter ferrireducens]MTI53711.1 cobalamin-binding protein [Geosporobacter ferrireducens]